ncbi:MAG: hypothetical protein AMXMBFR58_11280 [Phycisphaerae bacterium]
MSKKTTPKKTKTSPTRKPASTKPAKAFTKPAAPKASPGKPVSPDKPKRRSALDAAAIVLAKVGKPMNAKDMIDAMAATGLWKSPGGKTPQATLYAALIREIRDKGKKARFRKVERGQFAAAGR